MRKVIKIVGVIVVVLLLAVTIFDLHILRGYFLVPYMYEDTLEKFNGKFEYTITQNANGTFDLYLKNKNLAYYPIVLYRDNLFFDLNDTIIFNYAGRVKLYNNDTTIYDTGGGFDCGTGLGWALIRPYESFELMNVKVEDLIPLLEYYVNETKEMGIHFEDDTLTCQFYLPIFSFGEEATRVYSNKIVIAATKKPNTTRLEFQR